MKKIYPGKADYFDFSSAEMIAAEIFLAQQSLILTNAGNCISDKNIPHSLNILKVGL